MKTKRYRIYKVSLGVLTKLPVSGKNHSHDNYLDALNVANDLLGRYMKGTQIAIMDDTSRTIITLITQ